MGPWSFESLTGVVMKHTLLGSAIAVIATLSLAAGDLSAQPPVPGGGQFSRPPAFSPYLNLLRSGGSPALNYFGLVRPEMQFRQAIQTLNADVSQNRQLIGNMDPTGSGLPFTGHPTQFMNLGGYFMNSGSNAASGSRYGSGPANRSGGAGGAMSGGGASPPRR